jgi:hypothetical protein
MDAMLDAPKRNYPCSSVAELQRQLCDILNAKVTPKKAEHISVTFELGSTAVFDVPEADTESGAVDGVSARHSPSMSGSPVTRRICASDTLLNQPQDDPVLQMTVSTHLVASLEEVDCGKWSVHQVSLDSQGWTFTYICKDSYQAWRRQDARHPARKLVGEWSNEDGQDPVNMSQAAFCHNEVNPLTRSSQVALLLTVEALLQSRLPRRAGLLTSNMITPRYTRLSPSS